MARSINIPPTPGLFRANIPPPIAIRDTRVGSIASHGIGTVKAFITPPKTPKTPAATLIAGHFIVIPRAKIAPAEESRQTVTASGNRMSTASGGSYTIYRHDIKTINI
ncbi:hypothetical protein M1O47_04195 [Dehalococcoidia bacterium]|nr:hypothetical protein [Dehalococcoidia bacterium]